MTTAAYIRVSTEEQDERMQVQAVAKWADGRTVEHYTERISGSLAKADRPQLSRLLADAKAGKIQRVVIWALDRLTRRGAVEGLTILQALMDAGAVVESIQEPWIASMSDPDLRDMFTSVALTFAKMESKRRKARQMEGIAAIRNMKPGTPVVAKSGREYVAGGGKCGWGGSVAGREMIQGDKRRAFEAMVRGGASYSEIRAALHMGPNTITRYKRMMQAQET